VRDAVRGPRFGHRRWRAAIFAPNARIALNGAGSKEMSGPIEGLNVTLNGGNWSIG
jgi:hypothetical protein